MVAELDTYAVPEPLERVRRDIRNAVVALSPQEVRYLVDLYYSVQDFRLSTGNQVRALGEAAEPRTLLGWGHGTFTTVEDEVRKGLAAWCRGEPTGLAAWCLSVTGLGPVITAGLLAHIDITRAPTAGHIWRFAGLDPTAEWARGQKRPWNAALKVLCWKLGESFVKVSNNPRDVYGKLYAARKELEAGQNAAGLYAEQAAAVLARKQIGKATDAYKAYSAGRLPPAHLHARAKRYAVKAFLSSYHHVAYELHYGTPPPLPYAITQLGHAHLRGVPNHTCRTG